MIGSLLRIGTYPLALAAALPALALALAFLTFSFLATSSALAAWASDRAEALFLLVDYLVLG